MIASTVIFGFRQICRSFDLQLQQFGDQGVPPSLALVGWLVDRTSQGRGPGGQVVPPDKTCLRSFKFSNEHGQPQPLTLRSETPQDFTGVEGRGLSAAVVEGLGCIGLAVPRVARRAAPSKSRPPALCASSNIDTR